MWRFSCGDPCWNRVECHHRRTERTADSTRRCSTTYACPVATAFKRSFAESDPFRWPSHDRRTIQFGCRMQKVAAVYDGLLTGIHTSGRGPTIPESNVLASGITTSTVETQAPRLTFVAYSARTNSHVAVATQPVVARSTSSQVTVASTMARLNALKRSRGDRQDVETTSRRACTSAVDPC